MQRLPPAFAERDATIVAPELLNKLLAVNGRLARVTEVEAYTADDPASHSFRGRYGMHHCLNLVTGAEGDGQAVLIRSIVVDGVDPRRTTGPGRLCRELGIDRSLDGSEAELFDDGVPPPHSPEATPRIGITKAADWPRRWRV